MYTDIETETEAYQVTEAPYMQGQLCFNMFLQSFFDR